MIVFYIVFVCCDLYVLIVIEQDGCLLYWIYIESGYVLFYCDFLVEFDVVCVLCDDVECYYFLFVVFYYLYQLSVMNFFDVECVCYFGMILFVGCDEVEVFMMECDCVSYGVVVNLL